MKIGPTAKDLSGRYEYHLDFPGNALDPGCDYEHWSRRITNGKEPAVYAHLATDPSHSGKLALQYWFFYAFNEFNNLHKGDWEMIQLRLRRRRCPAGARRRTVEVGYSSHEGAERAHWGDDKLALVDGTHGRLSGRGLAREQVHGGALSRELRRRGRGLRRHARRPRRARAGRPTSSRAIRGGGAEFPWITFEGRWGELQKAFFDGPTDRT